MMVRMSMAPLSRDVLRGANVFPLNHPVHQLVPVAALVHGAEPCHALKSFVFDFHGKVWLTHECLT